MMAPLQKRSLFALLLETLWALAIILVFISQGGAAKWDTDADFRLIMDGMWVGGLILYWWLFSSLDHRPDQFDERDKTVIDRASKVQWWAVIMSLVAWVIGLSEHYHAQGQIPVILLSLIFFSTLIASTLAQSVGILFGYWRMNRNA
jgi:hypothetical protein